MSHLSAPPPVFRVSILAQLQQKLGDTYVVDREIGRGGMATVYLAHDEKHQRKVALKVLDPELGAMLGAERFLSEIRVTAALQHPNLLPLFDSGEAGGLLYYVMPYVEGESLRHTLEREKQLPVEEAVRIAVGIANALEYAHRHGVIHRDLKPENILLQAGQPVIADFGIALAVSNAGGARITQTGLSLGTPQYMSPEQATGDRVIDGRADVYSLAAVTYEMLCGEPPHSGTSAQAIIAKLMTTPPQPVRMLRPSVPAHIAMAVEHALEKLPADRFATAKAFADALTNPGFSTAVQAAVSSPAAATRSTRAIWALGALSAASLAAAALGWMRPAEPLPVRRYTIVPDSNAAMIPTGRWGRITLSPDGSSLVYVGGPSNGLMLRRRDELTAKMIAGTEQSGAPTFSPDGRRVAFITNARTLKIVSLDGSPPITVVDSIVGLAGLSWGDDNFIYADGQGSTPLVRVAAQAGGRPEHFVALDTAQGETDQVFPHVLPKGAGILYVSWWNKGTRQLGAAILDPKTGRRRVIVDGALRAVYVASGHLLYTTATGFLMAAPFDLSSQQLTGEAVVVGEGLATEQIALDFAASSSGTLAYLSGFGGVQDRELVWVTRNGIVQAIDSSWRGAFVDPAISPDGKQIAVSTGGVIGNMTSGDIWVRRLESRALTKFTVDGAYSRFPTWSHDGKTIRYSSTLGNTFGVLEKPADGSAAPVQRFSTAVAVLGLTATPDAQWIVHSEGTGGSQRIYAHRAGDTARVSLFPNDRVSRNPALSRDGKWLAYVLPENGTSSVYVSPFPNPASTRWLVSPKGGTEPVWSNRGTELFYRNPLSQEMLAVTVSTAPTFSFGPPRVLFLARDYIGRFAIAPDDSRFLMVRRMGAASVERLTIVDNWTADLSRSREK
jgi:eukaryotic-like serine/threonine-protein kinase